MAYNLLKYSYTIYKVVANGMECALTVTMAYKFDLFLTVAFVSEYYLLKVNSVNFCGLSILS